MVSQAKQKKKLIELLMLASVCESRDTAKKLLKKEKKVRKKMAKISEAYPRGYEDGITPMPPLKTQ